jgi:hypothetical protein
MSAGKFSKWVVKFSIAHLWIFTWAVVIASIKGYIIPDSLIVANFAFFGTELVGLLALKVFRVKKEVSNV